MAAADHALDHPALVDLGRRLRVTIFRPLRKIVTVSEIASTSSRKCEMKTMLRPLARDAAQHLEQPLHLGRRQRRGRLVEDDDAGAREQHAGELDQLLQADRQRAHAGARIDVDAEAGEMLAGAARPCARQSTMPSRGDRLLAEKDVLGDREVGNDRSAPGAPCRCRRPAHRAPSGSAPRVPSIVMRPSILRVNAGDDLHQRRLAGAVLADQAVDLAAAQREVDVAAAPRRRRTTWRCPDSHERRRSVARRRRVLSRHGVIARSDQEVLLHPQHAGARSPW